MAFPVVDATAQSKETGEVSTHTVTLPTGIVSGDLLIAVFEVNDNPNVTWPGGWTVLASGASPGNQARIEIAYRTADGTEGANISLDTSTNEVSVHQTYRISGQHSTSNPESSTIATGTDAAPDPGSLSPSWGAEDTLWIAAHAVDRDRTTSSAPTNYTNLLTDTAGTGARGVGGASARREINAASEDPGGFTISASDQWVSFVIAIRPAGGGVTETATFAAAATVGATFTNVVSAGGTMSASANALDGAAVGSTQATATILEALSAGDIESSAAQALASIAESVLAGESFTSAVSNALGQIIESANALESLSAAVQAIATFTDNANAADALTSVAQTIGIIAEAVSASDSFTGSIGGTQATFLDSVSASDLISVAASAIADITESTAASDAMIASVVATGLIVEAVTASDSMDASLRLLATIVESVTAGDTMSATVTITGIINVLDTHIHALRQRSRLHEIGDRGRTHIVRSRDRSEELS